MGLELIERLIEFERVGNGFGGKNKKNLLLKPCRLSKNINFNILKRFKNLHDLRLLASNFQIYGDFVDGGYYGSGHINDTYALNFDQAGKRVRYILQRINHNVFPSPPDLMNNIVRVTNHVRKKLALKCEDDLSRRVLTVVPTIDGQDYYLDAEGNHWRIYFFIEKARTYDVLEDIDQAYHAARAFGEFQKMLVDLPQPPLHEIIPGFHNGLMRFDAFTKALEKDEHNRAASAKAEIEFLQSHAEVFGVIPKLVEQGDIPICTTHNDCKINNVMLDDATGEGVCVIDLDTLMPGVALFDFGDMVRTSTSTAAEDETDLSKMTMDMDRFEAICKGYLSSAGEFLNQAERDHLVFAGKMITQIIGTRFLTDYLAGDVYFKTHREGHNLDRCRTQFKLVQSIEEQEDLMRSTAEAFYSTI